MNTFADQTGQMHTYHVTLGFEVEAMDIPAAIEEFRWDVANGPAYVYGVDDGETLVSYDAETREATPAVRLDKGAVDAVMAELDAAYTDLRSETYPYPTQYERVDRAKTAVYKLLGMV